MGKGSKRPDVGGEAAHSLPQDLEWPFELCATAVTWAWYFSERAGGLRCLYQERAVRRDRDLRECAHFESRGT